MRLYKALALSSVLAAIIVIAPFISAYFASAIADAYGCTVNEAFADPCIVAGIDISGTLYVMFTSFWLFIFSFLYIPVAIGLAVAAAIVWFRDRSGKYAIRTVGLVFWLLLFACLMFPLVTKLSLLLMLVAAGTHFWRRRNSTQMNQ